MFRQSNRGMAMLQILVINFIVISGVVVLHYEFLHWFTRLLPKLRLVHRQRIVLGVLTALVAHTLEIMIFALA